MGRREGGGKGAADHGPGPLVLDTLSSFSDERLWTVRRAVFAENDLVVLHGGANEVLHLDPTGALLSAFGRTGGGEDRIPRPVFDDLLTDGQRVALQLHEFGDDHPGEWLPLDRGGNEVGMWVLPASLRILALKGDRLAVVARDSLDVETLLMLGVREGSAPL